MKLVLSLTLVLGVLLALDTRPAEACSFAPNGTYQLDPAFASDATPPSAPAVMPTVQRWEYPSSCFDIAMIGVVVTATDDASPATRMGYQFRVVGGDPPQGLDLVDYAIAPSSIGAEIGLFFNYREKQFAFDLEVRAVDLNGNVGPPTVVFISDDLTEPPLEEDQAGAGCSATRSSTPGALASLLALCVLVLARRPRR